MYFLESGKSYLGLRFLQKFGQKLTKKQIFGIFDLFDFWDFQSEKNLNSALKLAYPEFKKLLSLKNNEEILLNYFMLKRSRNWCCAVLIVFLHDFLWNTYDIRSFKQNVNKFLVDKFFRLP